MKCLDVSIAVYGLCRASVVLKPSGSVWQRQGQLLAAQACSDLCPESFHQTANASLCGIVGKY